MWFFLVMAPLFAADWEIEFDDDAEASIYFKGAKVMWMNVDARGQKWKGVNFKAKAEERKGKKIPLTWSSDKLDFSITGDIQPKGEGTWQWDLHGKAKKNWKDIRGCYMTFRFKIDAIPFQGREIKPTNLGEKEGWRWEPVEGEVIEFRIDPQPEEPLVNERTKTQINVSLYGSEIKKGNSKWTITLKLPEGAQERKPKKEASVSSDEWVKDLFDHDNAPIDLSHINHKPAGKFGPVIAKGERLQFQNGGVVKFWGVTLRDRALFDTDDENVAVHAKRLAKLGINLVRITEHDNVKSKTNIFQDGDNTLNLNEEAMAKLDLWVKHLKEEGIYVWFDLHANRLFKKGDGIDGFEELSKRFWGKDRGKYARATGHCYVNESIEKRMREFIAKFLVYQGPHTGNKWKDDPAIIGFLVARNNNLTYEQRNEVRSRAPKAYEEKLEEMFKKFCEKKKIPYKKRELRKTQPKTNLFFSQLEYSWNRSMARYLLSGVGRKLFSMTDFQSEYPAYSLPGYSLNNIIFARSEAGNELMKHPLYKANFFCAPIFAQIKGKPMLWNWSIDDKKGNDMRYSLPIYAAAVASMQDWDIVIVDAYSEHGLNRGSRLDVDSIYNDPAVMGTMPAAALLFRKEHMQKADKEAALILSEDDLLKDDFTGPKSTAIRTSAERYKMMTVLPNIKKLRWFNGDAPPEGAKKITDPNQAYVSDFEESITSGTRELKRNWKKGMLTIDTPKTQAICGLTEQQDIRTEDCVFSISSPERALVIVQSADWRPISRSDKIVITIAARVVRSGNSALSEPVHGTIKIKSVAGRTCYPLKPDGSKGEPLEIEHDGTYYTVKLPGEMITHWLVLD